jgi:LDH2 family malate/lactate/ureidoglycolate dehydrogenase
MNFSAEQLTDMGMRLFLARGIRKHIAEQVVDSLVLSNLLGVDSHGVVRIRNYFDSIDVGAIVPDAEPKVVRDNGVAVILDGQKAFGQVAARRAARMAIRKARKYAIGVVSFTDVYHIGRLGEYVNMAAEEGLIAFMVANGSRPGGLVTPYGARQRMLGTNPLAFAIPANGHPPLVADFSTSAVSEGRVRIALRKGEKIPQGWLVDQEGRASDQPSSLYDGGSILPFGDYKGYALSLFVEVVGGILSGADTPISPGYGYMHNGVFLMVIQPTYFRPELQYRAAVEHLFLSIKNALPALGMDGALIPGEPEWRARCKREKEGVPMDPHTWAELKEVASKWNVKLIDPYPAGIAAGD